MTSNLSLDISEHHWGPHTLLDTGVQVPCIQTIALQVCCIVVVCMRGDLVKTWTRQKWKNHSPPNCLLGP